MFTVYNKGSVTFRSTIDNLYEVKNTQRPDKSNFNPSDDTLIQDYSQKEEQSPHPNQAEINAYKKMANMKSSDIIYHVKDIMTANCIHIDISNTILEAYHSLRENKVSQIPIVSQSNTIMGMINKKMILNLIIDDVDYSKHTLQKKLNDIYLPELITTDPISDIRRVAKVMIDFKLDAIPVVNKNDFLVGIVSKTDIIKAVATIPKLHLWA